MDNVGDALIRIKNGYQVGKATVNMRFSNLIWTLAKLLQKEGYVADVAKENNGIMVTLKYNSRVPAVTDLKRVSKPSLRVYRGVQELPKVLDGLGIAVISTPKGLMTDKEARKAQVGGEVLALVW